MNEMYIPHIKYSRHQKKPITQQWAFSCVIVF